MGKARKVTPGKKQISINYLLNNRRGWTFNHPLLFLFIWFLPVKIADTVTIAVNHAILLRYIDLPACESTFPGTVTVADGPGGCYNGINLILGKIFAGFIGIAGIVT